MTRDVLDQLAALLHQQREDLLARWRKEVRQLPAAAELDTPTLNDHIPGLLDDLGAALEVNSDQTIAQALSESGPPAHGLQRLHENFNIEEVVAEYNILRGCIHDLAEENGLNLQGRPFHVINRVLDHAIGSALQTYSTQQALEIQHRRQEYLAFVAHDLRTPLSAISLAGRVLELTLAKQEVGADVAQLLQTLRRSANQLEELVNEILEECTHLDTSDGIKLERRKFDLWPLVEGLHHDLHSVAEEQGTQLVNTIPVDLVVYADASLLRRVFQNLITNAIHYTSGGEVTIGARHRESEGYVECWVRDNGTGIAPEQLEKVFDAGESDPNHASGKGLGLAIVKTFIEAHGGTVSVESTPGSGSNFRISLPNKSRAHE